MMNPSIEEITNWLESKSSHTLHISKEEDKDQDQIELQLERLEHHQHQEPSIDGYGDRSALLLHGSGVVMTAGHTAPLPTNAYVIGLDGLKAAEIHDNHVVLTTERGTYTIKAT
ncbi:hypothetical protein C7121_10535 [Paenibacillus glucanolyticus]|jgi:hypothetical protein|nr:MULTISPECIES: hypothetical protein [Paenibacillus]ANA79521.1 hypothetical protein A3958_05765 [Paenibacillus glucanolyticus]AVV56529.1 hypothetical protein C7121_10535 [Paenibacillus glucanolyticus]AWP25696.1 hypothetical protein B9D94_03215 [Paenibacillus sp. Cedars]KZS45463.1 hypothetical protein AWU65_05765 [Paenibacillus glucanolyticus]MDH6673844.1 hypothetical protein [Paenibacillus sp. LBL]